MEIGFGIYGNSKARGNKVREGEMIKHHDPLPSLTKK